MDTMRASVIVRSKDEADRLRLTLASLAVQTQPAEVVVVNDGSTDHTSAVIASAAEQLELVRIDHAVPCGRSGAANAGAARASGELLIFLDGDTLVNPDFVSRHLAVHRDTAGVVGRGETFHLRCTRFFADPETGSPMPGEENRIARMSAAEHERMLITRSDIMSNFESIDRRAQPGIYPGAGPRRLYELEMDALRTLHGSQILWVAASGSNMSVDRDTVRAVGGFDPDLTINEHRELALRLCDAGLRMVAVDGARSYHMTHRSGWRDPLTEPDWEVRFYETHPIPEVPLLSILWGSLAEPLPFPKEAQITSLPELSAAATRCAGALGIETVRHAHFAAAGSAASPQEGC